MIVLDLDAGNTCLKWRLSNDSAIIDKGVLMNAGDITFQLEKTLWALLPITDYCRLSSVRSKAITHQILSLVRNFGVSVSQPVIMQHYGGVLLHKTNINKFGIDRWLALLSAKQLVGAQPIMVVDCGTAITIDFLSVQGVYEGGWIVPGLHSLLDTLVRKTDLLHKPARLECRRELGFCTADAMQYGVCTMAASMIEQAYQRWQTPGVLMLCGGDAAAIAKVIHVPFDYHDNLVLDGLPIALPDITASKLAKVCQNEIA